MQSSDALRVAMRAIGENRGPGFDRGWPDAPWDLTVDASTWAVTTDGRLLLMVPRERIEGACEPCPTAVVKLASKLARTESTKTLMCAGSLVRAFAQSVPIQVACARCDGSRWIDCDSCDGQGSHECECTACGDVHDKDCRTCGGDGNSPCPDCQPRVPVMPEAAWLGRAINRQNIARLLDAVQPANEELIAVSRDAGTYMLRGPDWFALIAALREGTTTTADFDQPETWQPVGAGSQR